MTRRKTFTTWQELKGRSSIPHFAKVAILERLKDPQFSRAQLISYQDDPEIYVEFYGHEDGMFFVLDIISFSMEPPDKTRLFKTFDSTSHLDFWPHSVGGGK